MKILRLFVLILSICFLYISCKDNSTSPEEDSANLVQDGWAFYKNSEYQSALDKFDAAILKDSQNIEAYSGSGWANAKLTYLDESISKFDKGLSIDTLYNDILVGLAFVFNAKKDYLKSNEHLDLLFQQNSHWQFANEQNLDYKDLYLLFAENYFAIAGFEQSLLYVRKLNYSFNADISIIDGITELGLEIERLKSIT